MRKRKGNNNIISFVLFIVLIAVTFFVILKHTDTNNLIDVLSDIKPISIFTGIACMLICVACEGECIRVICKSLGCKVGFLKSFVYSCSDYYFSAITPSATGGQPAMAYYMSKDGIPFSKSSIALLLTLTEYMGVLVLLGIAAFFLDMNFILRNTLILVFFCIGLVFTSAVILGSLAAMYSENMVKKAGLFVIRIMHKIRFVRNYNMRARRFEAHLKEYKAGAQYIKEHPLISMRVFLICLIQRIMLFMVTYCVYRGMGLQGTPMISILAKQSVVMIAINTLPLPGGVGAAEGLFLVVFSNVFAGELIMPAMLLTRGINFYFSMFFAGTLTLVNHLIIMRKNKKHSSLTV